MKYVLSQKQMQELDRYSIEKMGISGLFLMEQAARACADYIEKNMAKDEKILIVVESGNNGGDGLAMARMLKEAKYDVMVFYIHGIKRASESFLEQKRLAEEKEVLIVEELPTEEQFDVIVDGIFGVGLRKQVRGIHAKVIEWMNRMPVKRVAIDLPSGVHATTGEILGTAFNADVTITFGYLKTGLLLYPGTEYAGEVVVKDIGFPEESLWHVMPEQYTFGNKFHDLERAAGYYPRRTARANKGSCGHVLLVVGAKGMAGAATFAAMAAYRSGCGLVRVITHESNRQILQIKVPEAVVLTYNTLQEAYNLLDENWLWADSVLVGSGLGLSDLAVGLTRAVVTYASEKKGSMPVVVDGDSISILGSHKEILETYHSLREDSRSYLTLTPHLKEMSRLNGKSVDEIANHLLDCANAFILQQGLIGKMSLVLKDARTVVTDGQKLSYINITGNAGMATAGSGDVLAGMITSLLAQNKKQPIDEQLPLTVRERLDLLPVCTNSNMLLACLAVYLHGWAGDYAEREKGQAALMASDLLDNLPQVLMEINI